MALRRLLPIEAGIVGNTRNLSGHTFYLADTYAERPTVDLRVGDLLIALDTLQFLLAVDATTWREIAKVDSTGRIPTNLAGSGIADATTFLRGDRTYAAPTAAAHATTHQPGGSDPMAVDAAAGTGSLRTLGTTGTNAAAGNDARLSDARTPTAHATTHQPGGSDLMTVDAAAATGSLRTIGTGALQATAGNDARLSDARTPTGTAGGDLAGTYPSPTVANNAITYAKMQDVSATDRVIGRLTAGAGDPEEIVCTAAGRALIDDVDAPAQRTTLGLGALATKSTVATADINDAAVTYAKIQNISATDRVIGRLTAGAGVAEEIICTAAGRAIIDDADAAAQRTTLGLGALAVKSTVATADIDNSAVTYAKIQNVSATARVLGRVSAGAGVTEELTATGGLEFGAAGIQTSALTGDVTKASAGTVTTIANSAVTNAKAANMPANTIKGNNTGASAAPLDLTGTQATALLDLVTSTVKGLAPLSGGGTAKFLRADATWAPPFTLISGNSGAAASGSAPTETLQILTANAAANSTTTLTTVMTTTGLPIGTYLFEYWIVWQSATATVGVKFAVDYTGTVTRVRTTRHYQSTGGAAAATGVADGVAATNTGQYVEHMSTRSDAGSLGPNTGVDTINADQFDVIRGIIVVSTSANLLLQHASETATSTQVMADTMMRLTRLA